MENISRGPTFGDFITILTEGTMQSPNFEGAQESIPRNHFRQAEAWCAGTKTLFLLGP